MNIILIEKDGSIMEKHVKTTTLDKLYSICGYRTNKDFEKLYEWDFDKNTYELYGKKTGKKDKENNFQFPKYEEKEKYYGSLCVVKKNGSISLDEWNIFYMSFASYENVKENETEGETDTDDADVANMDCILDVKRQPQSREELELTYEEYEEES
jgi:hypothetical protein